ncbi:hypothetical protein GCM10010495_72060 [Kitasatospora herbaricolor]|uniref:hypothetical protein n=1 Tax=Kitasatospora herbaricolor TaxID=68217 RepID=UPI0017482F95|nr:hypothetical protein [Kitasatospora herbaricolor]MDQ0306376.1 hypothetical protein [Kitasatospora herbaricolor]GGV44026.1 hypothetical protein GCM10010495_72060 [Kitasatospora herbaricolor]
MRITDARTGRGTEIRPRRAGLLRVRTLVGGPGRPFDLSDLRALLVTDLLLRTGEIRHLQVTTSLGHPATDPQEVKLLQRDAGLLGIHPPADDESGAADLEVRAHRAGPAAPPAAPEHAPEAGEPPPCIEVGPVTAPFPPDTSGLPSPLAALSPAGPEPLAVRLALFGTPHHAPVELTAESLAEAQATLQRWRRVVTEAARTVSRPPFADAVQRAFDGFADDLDPAPALRLLDELSTRPELPTGAVFETFVRVDQVLALELSRDVGWSPR